MRFGSNLPTDSEIVVAIFCGTLQEAFKEYMHVFDYNYKGQFKYSCGEAKAKIEKRGTLEIKP